VTHTFVVLVHLDFVYVMFEGQDHRSKQCLFQVSVSENFRPKIFPPKDRRMDFTDVHFTLNCRREKSQVLLIAGPYANSVIVFTSPKMS